MASELLMLMTSKGNPVLLTLGKNQYGIDGLGTQGGEFNPALVQIASNITAQPAYGAASSNNAYIKSDGTLWAWGYGIDGAVGDSNAVNRSSPVQIGTDTNWAQISFGIGNTLARKTNGTLWSWGDDIAGVAGQNNNTGVTYSSPTQIGALTTWTNLATAEYSAFAIKGGALWAWGANTFGQLGKNTIIDYSSPIQIGALTTWSKITTNGWQSAGITTAGALWMWGYNPDGQLGNNTIIDRSSPVQVTGGGNWISVASASNTTIGIKNGGTLWAWGYNTFDGQFYSSPVNIGADTNWASVVGSGTGGNVAYTNVTFILTKTNGTAWVLGRLPYSSLLPQNLGSSSNPLAVIYTSSPVQIGSATNWSIASISNIGDEATISIKDTSNNFYTFGNSFLLGQNKIYFNSYSSPVQIGAAKSYTRVASGDVQSLFIKPNKTLWTSGFNFSNSVYRSSPVQITSPSNTWSDVWCNYQSNFAKDTSNVLWAWGDNAYGQLGTVDVIGKSSPTQVKSNVIQVSTASGTAPLGGAPTHTLMIFESSPSVGSSKGWLFATGRNSSGQLGIGNNLSQSSPVQVGSLYYKKVAVGASFSGALDDSGNLYMFGLNSDGQLGRNNRTNASSPVQIAGKVFADFGLTGASVAAITTDGKLWTWGSNSNGVLANGNTLLVARSSPVQVGALTDWQKVFCGGSYVIATKTDKTIWAWGSLINSDGNAIYRSSPVQIASGYNPIRGTAAPRYNFMFIENQ